MATASMMAMASAPVIAGERGETTANEKSEKSTTRFKHKVGALGSGNDVLVKECTLEDAKKIAEETAACVGFTFYGDEAGAGGGKKRVFFKSSDDGNDDPAWQTFLVCRPDGWAAASSMEKEGILDYPPVSEYVPDRLVVDLATGRLADTVGGARFPLPIGAYPCVDDRAVGLAADTVCGMLERTPLEIRRRMSDRGACVGIIGRSQLTCDVPAHRHLRALECRDGRGYDAETRGLGGVPGCPCTSVGEENLLMEDDAHFPEESILVHEFGHAVMDLGLSDEEADSVRECYKTATDGETRGAEGWLGEAGSNYMLSCPEEFWAEATQAWFSASARSDVNCDLRCRGDVREWCGEGFVRLLVRAYGDGEWRYVHDCPRPWDGRRL